MTAATPNPTHWIKAQRSQNANGCVEMRRVESVEVRDTKQLGQGPTLTVDRAAFARWIAGAKAGELDHLIEL
jgi:folate-dependent tRNA-U54 methylase TrmFO/GidA